MTKESLTFVDYIQNYDTDNTVKFKAIFDNKITNIPNKSLSSKQLMNLLQLESAVQFVIFRQTYMEYFKLKLK